MRAVFGEAPDHYELLDRTLIGQLAGFLYCCAGVIASALLVVHPPTDAMGGGGWLAALVITGLAFVFGVAMVVNRRELSANLLLAVALSGPVMLGVLQWLAGWAASYIQLLVLSVIWCGVVLPGPRLLLVILVDTVVIFVPAALGSWEEDALPDRLATTGIAWALAVACLVYTFHQRNMRRLLRAQRREADELARVDALTGLGNRRALDEALAAQVALAERTGRPLAALVGDLDRFKVINDTFGHRAGDVLLRDVAAVLRDVIRRPDACFRWGGDEFVVLLAEVDETDARDVAARIATAVAQRCHAPDGVPVRISLGAAVHGTGRPAPELLSDADDDLLGRKPRARA